MALGAWRQADSPPATGQLADPLDDVSRARWSRLTRWLGDTYGLEGEPAWEGRERGWVLRVRRAGRPLVTLSPMTDGGFGVLVVIGPSLMPRVQEAELSVAMRAVIDGANAYPDGRWISLEPADDQAVEDICRLVALKSPPPRRRRTAVPAG